MADRRDTYKIGLCPHCKSSRIRLRRQRHRNFLWRCRSCNRAFRTPLVRRTRSERGDVERCVLASDIPRMERGRRISGRPWRRRNRHRGRSALAAFLVVALVILSAGIWWLATEKDYDWDRLTAATAPEHLAATPETQQRRSGGVVATPPPATGSTATDFRAISTSAPPEPRRAGDRHTGAFWQRSRAGRKHRCHRHRCCGQTSGTLKKSDTC